MLQIENIVKTYRSKSGTATRALKGVSFNFPQKGLVFIVGKSGSGKSTLLNILGLLDSYDEGDLIINGKSSRLLTQNEMDSWRAVNIGFVFQEFHIIDKYNIGQNIALSLDIRQGGRIKGVRNGTSDCLESADAGLVNNKIEGKSNKELIAQALTTVGLKGLEKRKSAELSGGQRQRVAIARALIKDPKVILADEPTGNLDSENSKAIFHLLKDLSKEKLVIVISHDAESASTYADEIIYLEDGKIARVSRGNEYYETVEEIVEGELDTQRLEALIKSGKRVVLLPKPRPTPKRENAQPVGPLGAESSTHQTKLPTKTKLRLAMLAMKSKAVRMFFTVLLSCTAISFLGFSDIIGRYDTMRLIRADVANSKSPFISVEAQSVIENGMLTEYGSILMLNDSQNKLKAKLESNNIQYLTKYAGSNMYLGLNKTPAAFTNEHSRNIKRFFYASTSSFAQIPDGYNFEGIEVLGRLPQNRNEVMITSYHLETYKRFDFNDHTGFSRKNPRYKEPIKINSFEDIEGKYIAGSYETDYGLVERYKIVGMVNFDLSNYEELFDLPSGISLTKSQSDLLLDAVKNINLYLGTLFVHKDFIEYWTNTNNFSSSSLSFMRGDVILNADRVGTITLTENCWPYRYEDYIVDMDKPDYGAPIDVLADLAKCHNIYLNNASYSFDEHNNLKVVSKGGNSPFVSFYLDNYLLTSVSNPTITIDGNFNGNNVGIFYQTLGGEYGVNKSVSLSEFNKTGILPIKANEIIMALRVDVATGAEAKITSIEIDGLEYYRGPDANPPIIFADNFTKESLATATNKAVIDAVTLQALLGSQAEGISLPENPKRSDYQDYFNAVKNSGADLTNFTVSFTRSWNDTITMQGVYTFEVVGIFAANNKTFIPTSDFAKTYHYDFATDFLVPRQGNEETAVNLFGAGVADSLIAPTEAANTWMGYGGQIRFILRTSNSSAIFAIDSYFSLFVSIFNIASLVFCVFAMLLTYNFIASSINARKKDIGILRSLGAKRIDVAWIFIIEVALIAVAEIIFSCLLTLGMFRALNYYFISKMGVIAQQHTLVSYGIRQPLIMAAVAIISIAISVALPIIRITRRQPVDIIKSQD